MKNVLNSTTKVRFQDCDPYNHLNNSKYLDYFMNAREDQILDAYGIDMYKHILRTGNGWVVASNQIVYLKPAFLMEEVVIESQLIQYDESTLLVEMKMWKADKSHLKSILWSRFTYIDAQKQKRNAHENDLMELFESIVQPVGTIVFEERCGQLIGELKAMEKSV